MASFRRALLHLAGLWFCLVVLWLPWLRGPWIFRPYLAYDRGWSPAARAAHSLALAQKTSGRRCLIVGNSAMAAAVQPDILQRFLPGCQVFGVTSLGPTISGVESSLLLLEQSGVRPDLLVLGLNPYFVRPIKLDLSETDYLSFLDPANAGPLLSRFPPGTRERAEWQVLSGTLWPYHRHRHIIWRLLMDGLAVGQRLRGGHALPRESFIKMPLPDPDWHGQQTPEYRLAQLQLLRDHGMVPEHQGQMLSGLRAVLQKAPTLSPHVVIVQLPTHSLLRQALVPFRGLFDTALLQAQARGPLTLLDLSALLPDDDFYDLVHPRKQAKQAISEALGRGLAR